MTAVLLILDHDMSQLTVQVMIIRQVFPGLSATMSRSRLLLPDLEELGDRLRFWIHVRFCEMRTPVAVWFQLFP